MNTPKADIRSLRRTALALIPACTAALIVAFTVALASGFALTLLSPAALAQAGTEASSESPLESPLEQTRREKIRQESEEAARRNEKAGFRGVIQGRVLLDNGKPAVGFPVFASYSPRMSREQGEGYAITDSRGGYRIRGLNPVNWRGDGPQSFRVEVSSAGGPFIADPSRIVPLGRTRHHTAINVNFTMHRSPLITVRVRDAQTGAPVPGVLVAAAPEMSNGSKVEGVTDARGEFRYRVRELGSTIYLKDIDRDGVSIVVAPSFQEVRFSGIADLHDVTIEVKAFTEKQETATGVYHGVVRNSDGMPVVGAVVRLEAGKEGAKAVHSFAVGERQPNLELRLGKPESSPQKPR